MSVWSKDATLMICHTCENRIGWGLARVVYEPGQDEVRRAFLREHQDHGKGLP